MLLKFNKVFLFILVVILWTLNILLFLLEKHEKRLIEGIKIYEKFKSNSEPNIITEEKTFFWDSLPVSYDAQCLLSTSFDNVTAKMFPEEDAHFLNSKEGKEYKTILFWNYFHTDNYAFGRGRKPFESACCKEKRCFATKRRDLLPLKDFDAILFHHINLFDDMMPKERWNRGGSQRWIFFEREPPTFSFGKLESFKSSFNWTMTYRRDSDVFAGYGYVIPKSKFLSQNNESFNNYHMNLENQIRSKTKMAAWIVSDCDTPSLRELIVEELKNYIKIDVYGYCGDLECKRSDQVKCYKMLEKNYKFYLSFENSLCKDYVSEKFFQIIKWNIVPVVYGSADYDSFAPPHSYINARDFVSAHQLAGHLKDLNENDAAYLQYFEWKKHFSVRSMYWITTALNFCNLCQMLHDDVNNTKTYQDIRQWYFQEAECINLKPK